MVVTPTGLRFMGRKFPCTIGRGGIVASKREGDGSKTFSVLDLERIESDFFSFPYPSDLRLASDGFLIF